jgi:hypothetical protein
MDLSYNLGDVAVLKNGGKVKIDTIKINSKGVYYYNSQSCILYKESDFVNNKQYERPTEISHSTGATKQERSGDTSGELETTGQGTEADRLSNSSTNRRSKRKKSSISVDSEESTI